MSEIYVNIEGIKGEATNSDHRDWIEALSVFYSVLQSASMASGGGGGVGKADFPGVTFTHYYDRASPNLFKFCAAGKHIDTVVISACKAGGGSKEFARIILSGAFITQVVPTGNAGSMWVESVHLVYSKIKLEYREQKSTGTMGPSVCCGWDIKQNRET